ncbi:MAG: hypothetical protein CL698_03805, partial [Chloroflexi bacterium]|nr:hypothetical protein [Chloroflexota bacterium]
MKTRTVCALIFLFFICLGSFSIVFADALQTGIDAYQRKDFKTAYKVLNELAQQGNPDAQLTLGTMYAIGQGTEGITEIERLRASRKLLKAAASKHGENEKVKKLVAQIDDYFAKIKKEENERQEHEVRRLVREKAELEEQKKIAAEKAKQEKLAAEKAKQEKIAAEK